MLIKQLLPTKGLYCVAVAAGKGFIHEFFDDIEEAERYALRSSKAGKTVFIAQGSFLSEDNRKQKNVRSLRSFFLDIDCGEGKPYATQGDGVKALGQFVKDTGLPTPVVVNSGNGLYAYWPIETDIPQAQWRSVAKVLKEVCIAYDLAADPARTSDSASVLRPVGSINRKPGKTDKDVTLIRSAPSSTFVDFATRLGQAKKAKGLKVTLDKAPRQGTIDDEFQVYQPLPTSAHLVADKCPQIAHIKEVKGNVEEPLWYAAIGLLRYTTESPDIIHEWSAGHPQYSESATNAKIDQHIEVDAGPTTCSRFHSLRPEGCIGCPHKDKVKSPITLGRSLPQKLTTEDHDVDPPEPFYRTEEGLFYRTDDDANVRFYDSDLYPTSIAYDESLGYEIISLRHNLPNVGYHDFMIRSALIHDQKGLLTALSDNHVHVVGKEKKVMCSYIEGYAQRLQRQRKVGRLMCQMGWKDMGGEPAFVLGTKIYYRDGRVEAAPLARNIPEAAKAFRPEGSLADWIHATDYLGMPGMEPMAFAFLAGAFGAPLMKFTGYEGAMISMMGKSGIGKTLTTRWIQSVYGEQGRLMMLRDDTRNSLMSRLGVYGNLPLCIDEVTNIHENELSDLVYRVTQGRDRARLDHNAVEKANINHWNTLAVVSSNSSLVEKLSTAKSDASAEINRLFEFEVKSCPAFGRDEATGVFRTISNNYGHAGELYVKQLIAEYGKHTEQLDKIAAHIDSKITVEMEERFWIAVASVAVYGGMIARKLGIINFDIAPILKWVMEEISSMRIHKADMIDDPSSLLAIFLDEHVSNRLILDKQGTATVAIEEPRGELHIRIEMHNDRMYVSRDRFKSWVLRRGGNYAQVCKLLVDKRILVGQINRKNLGSHTRHKGGSQPCLEIHTTAPELGQTTLISVDKLTNTVHNRP